MQRTDVICNKAMSNHDLRLKSSALRVAICANRVPEERRSGSMQISQAARAYEFFIRSVCLSAAPLQRTIFVGKKQGAIRYRPSARVTRLGRLLSNHQISLTGIPSRRRNASTHHSPAAQIGQTAWKSPTPHASPLH
jgi:hypothetical protein